MTKWRLWFLTVVVVAAVIVAWWQLGRTRERPGIVGPDVVRSDCPKEWALDSLIDTTSKTLSVAGKITNVPEFHDCQRFMVRDNQGADLRFDGLFAIFATVRPGRLDTLEMLDLINFRGDTSAQHDFAVAAGINPDDGWPSAEIVAFDDGYEPLGIRSGFNCLYLYRGGAGNSRSWQAIMVPFGAKEQDCSLAIDPDTLKGYKHRLKVRVDVEAPADLAPAVAKWDWDAKREEHYIGIYCGDTTWCEVGRKKPEREEGGQDFTPSKRFLDRVAASPPPPTPQGQGWIRVYGVRGWYDEQYLAMPGPDGTLRPGRLLGTLIPHPDLGTYDDNSFVNAWKPAAEVSLIPEVAEGMRLEQVAQDSGQAPDPVGHPYARKLNLSLTDSTRLNTIELCHGDQCTGITDSLRRVSTERSWDHWYARITRAVDANVQLFAVKRCDLGVDVPGTARWRWLPNDETTWMRCSRGCCEIIEPGG